MSGLIGKKHVPLLATGSVFLLLYLGAAFRYEGFLGISVFLNLLRDNAFLGLAAVGMSFVILSGGIDLSVGAMVGFTSICLARLMGDLGVAPWVALPAMVLAGLAFGAGQGLLVSVFRLPPFLVTLAGMFLARGLAFVVSLENRSIQQPLYERLGDFSYDAFPVEILLFLGGLAAALYLAHCTRFGRNVYAVGGNEESASLMGLPVTLTKILTYALSGLCSSLAGIVYSLYTLSGNPTAGTMLELDAIAVVVIVGTLLTGGVGYLFGTFIGVLILGVIQTIITFEGTLSSWWTKIVVGGLVLGFILLQRFIQSQTSGALLRPWRARE